MAKLETNNLENISLMVKFLSISILSGSQSLMS